MASIPEIAESLQAKTVGCGLSDSLLAMSYSPRVRGIPTEILVANRLPRPVSLRWLGSDESEGTFNTVIPSFSGISQSTYSGHLWMVTEAATPSTCLAKFEAGSATCMIVLNAPQDAQVLSIDANFDLRESPYYAQYAASSGVLIKAAPVVEPGALVRAAEHVQVLLAHRRDIAKRMRGVQVAIVPQDAPICELPEFEADRDAAIDDGRRYNSFEIRGQFRQPDGAKLVAVPEENLLRSDNDRNPDEDLTYHELAHALLNVGLDSDERDRWQSIYTRAHASGLFTGLYADINQDEYWAELTQAWFHSSDPRAAGVSSADEIFDKDPSAHTFLSRVYGPAEQQSRRTEPLIGSESARERAEQGPTSPSVMDRTSRERMQVPPPVAGLCTLLPEQGSSWPAAARERWLEVLNNVLCGLYPDEETAS